MNNLPDVQKSTAGFKKTPIEKVGVRGIKVPFKVKKPNNKVFQTIATISSYCNLNQNSKGINMSRISRTINDVMSEDSLGFINLNKFITQLKKAHETDNVYIKARFDYLYNDKSPIEKVKSIQPINVTFESYYKNNNIKNYITVKTTEMSLCPCSKEMSLLINNVTEEQKEELNNINISQKLRFKINNSGFGAHNQKSIIQVKFEINPQKTFWFEDLLKIIKNNVSSPTWSTLKRGDQKYVTEVSYMGGYFDENYEFNKLQNTHGPMFVQDIVRNISNDLNDILDDKILDYVIIVNNQESIHSENVVATAIKSAGRILK